MKKIAPLLVLLVSFGCSSAATSSKSAPQPTKKELLEGAWVPERREFPLTAGLEPCQDFYKYACTGVLSGFKLRDDRSIHAFSFSDSRERLLTARKNYLKFLASHDAPTDRARMVKNTYAACMDEKAATKDARALLAEELALVNGIQSNAEFAKAMSDRIDQPGASFLGFATWAANQDNPLRSDLVLHGSLMDLPERSYYEHPEIVKELTSLYAGQFQRLGFSDAERRAAAVVDLEKRFAEVHPLPAEMRERYSKRTYVSREKMAASYPVFGLKRFFSRIPESVRVRDVTPESLAFLDRVMEKEPLPLLKDMWTALILRTYLIDAYPDLYLKRFAFSNRYLGGPKVMPDRQEQCTTSTLSQLGREIDAELLPILFPNFPEAKVVSLAEKIRGSIVSELKQNRWLSRQGRAGAIRKITSAHLLIFKPATEDDWNFNPKAEYSPSERYRNLRIHEKGQIEKDLSELGKDRNRTRWLMSPLDVNAYYTSEDNVFVLPAGILQYPFYDPAAPEETNLAAIGSVIGHELGHGIDDQGSKYDEKGRLHQWMTNADLKEFQKRGARFIPRFEALKHNGKLTMGENIGDHVGINASYLAAFGNGHDDAELKKAFFTQYARAWCYDARPAFKEMRLKTDPHAAGEARVNEQVRHLAGFQEAFSCKKGDPMYLDEAERIRVW